MTLLRSFGVCGFLGFLSYSRTGDIVALELAGAVAVPIFVFVRWVWPRYQYLQWGEPE